MKTQGIRLFDVNQIPTKELKVRHNWSHKYVRHNDNVTVFIRIWDTEMTACKNKFFEFVEIEKILTSNYNIFVLNDPVSN